jgi:hypothetical protein
METIYVALLDEGVDVWRPIQARHISSDIYLIESVNMNPSLEKWEFDTGDYVKCEEREIVNGNEPHKCKVALKKISA